MAERRKMLFVCVVVLAQVGRGQPSSSGLQFTQVSGVLPSSQCGDMAVDKTGRCFIVHPPASLTAVLPDGTILPSYVPPSATALSVTYDAGDGFVYAAAASTNSTSILRLSTPGGIVVSTVPVLVTNIEADGLGRFYLHTSTPGLASPFLLHDPNGPPGSTLVPVFTGFGGSLNHLLSLGNGDLLIADSNVVYRYARASGVLSLFYAVPPPYVTPLGSQPNTIRGLSRAPFNATGPGVCVALQRRQPGFFTAPPSDFNSSVFVGPNGTPTTTLFTTGGSLVLNSLSMASGPGRSLYFTTPYANAAPAVLYKATEIPAAGSNGSLLISSQQSSVTIDLFAGATPNPPFLLGFMLDPVPPASSVFIPGYGVTELDPLHPSYIPVFDGIGFFGPPAPAATVPPSGFHLELAIPAGLTGIALTCQASVISPAAPNSAYYVTNLAPLVLP